MRPVQREKLATTYPEIGKGQLSTMLVGRADPGPETEWPQTCAGDLFRGGTVRVGVPQPLLGRGVVVVVIPDPDGGGVQAADSVRAR